MRIAVVSGFPPDPYGEAHYSGQVFRSLARQFPDVKILICAHKNSFAPDKEQLLPNLKVHRVTQPRNRLNATAAFGPLLYHIVRFKPDLVHLEGTHTPRYGGFFGEPITFLIGVLRLMGVSSVFSAHSIWLPNECADLWKHKNIISPISKWLTWWYGVNLKLISRWSSLLSFVLAGDDSPILDVYKKTYRLDSTAIINEIHPCTFAPVSVERQMQAKKLLGFSKYTIALAIGFISPDKGYHLIIECSGKLLKKFPNLVLIIIGMPQGASGQNYAEILRKKRMTIPNNSRIIIKTEYLSDDVFSTYLEAADVIIVPYMQVKGPSGPVHHALGLGKPVIASAIGHNLGLESVCKLFPAGDAFALGSALNELISEPKQMKLYSNRSKAYASKHTWDNLACEYLSWYCKIMNNR